VNPDLRQRAEEVLAQLLDVEEPERVSALDRLCANHPAVAAEVQRLLDCIPAAESFFARFASGRDQDGSPLEGRRVGAYRITGELGRGGMGAVYRAERDDGQFVRQVAVKFVSVLAAGSDVWRRFEREKRILAGLLHPNIAQLLDAGVSEDSMPYIVMELVQGTPIDVYCRARELSVPARIRLFQQVCDAIAFIHRNLIVHHDIKPGNILVTPEGVPKLLDFGISRVLPAAGEEGEVTAPQRRLMTLHYSSPEQVRGEPVSTSSDIYTLGLLLYELLAGRPVHSLSGSSTEDILRQILEKDPPPPKAGPDIDQVVMKAISKAPSERYASARELAADLENYLEGRPVTAVQPTNLYRLGKWVRRHRAPVAAGVLVALTLIAAGGVVVWQMRVARRERAIAQQRFNDVRKLANSILFEFHDGVSKLAGATEVRRLMAARSLEYLDSLANDSRGDLGLQLELASAYLRLGDVQGNANFANLGDRKGALSSYGKGRAILEAALGAQQRHQLALLRMGGLLNSTRALLLQDGQRDASVETARKALAHWESMARSGPMDEDVLHGLGAACFGMGFDTRLPWEEAVGYWNRAKDVYGKLLEARPSDPARMRSVALVHKYLSGMYQNRDVGRLLEHARIAAELDERRVKASPQDAQAQLDLAQSLGMVAAGWNLKDDPTRAAGYAERSVQIRRALWEADSKDHRARDRLAYALTLLGQLRRKQKDRRSALACLREAVEHSEALTRSTDFQASWETLGWARVELAELYERLRPGDACAEYQRAAKAYRHLTKDRREDYATEISSVQAKLAACGVKSRAGPERDRE